jgi:formylglycine-generating enzyme required for sulfatase activity
MEHAMKRVQSAVSIVTTIGGVCFLAVAAQTKNQHPAFTLPKSLADPSPHPGPPDPASVVIETVIVANPGNPGETHSNETFGRVDYIYNIAQYEVTAGQYTVFLNAVAADDTYRLYNTNMWTHSEGCGIERTGEPGSLQYSIAPDLADRPVNFVGWADAARFANWMHNNQPTGAQDLITTEDGSYFINGIHEFADHLLEDVVRSPGATWVIPTEHEWYKAAYHANDGVTANYYNYPTSANGGISNALVDPDPGNNMTFHDQPEDTIGPPYWRTEVGAHENSASPYGTFDQGGNVQEWTEAVPENQIRRLRGGSYFWGSTLLFSSTLDDFYHSSDHFADIGFRLVEIP